MSAGSSVAAPADRLCVAGRYRVAHTWRQREDGTTFVRADDLVLCRPVLVKMAAAAPPAGGLGAGVEQADTRVAALFAEAQLLSRYAHSGVARVYDLGVADGLAYAVQQWVEGPPLSTRCAGTGLLQPEAAAALARVLCTLPAGLAASLRTEDIALRADGTPVAVSVSSPPEESQPVCLRDEAAVRAVALVLYEVLVGMRVAPGAGPGPLAPAHLHRPGVPVALGLVVQGGLAPAGPFSDLDAFSRALAPFAGGSASRALPAPMGGERGARRVVAGAGRRGGTARTWPALAGSLLVGVLGTAHLTLGLGWTGVPAEAHRPHATGARPLSLAAGAAPAGAPHDPRGTGVRGIYTPGR